MNPTSLEYFVRIAELGSISRTAIELGIEQSTMTRHIARLEADLNVRLFHRSGRGVVLTHAGTLLLTRARAVANALGETRRLAMALADEGPSELVIAAQPTLAQYSFANIARTLQARFPGTRLRMVETMGHQIINWLVEGKIDIALLYVPSQSALVDVDILMHEPLYLIAPPDSPALGPSITVPEMLERQLILPSTPHGVRGLVQSLAADHNTSLKIAVESDGSNAITKNLVQAGIGCAIMPLATAADEVARGTLQAARLVEPEVVREVAIATARNRPAVVGQWDILQQIRQLVGDRVSSGRWPGAREYQSSHAQKLSSAP